MELEDILDEIIILDKQNCFLRKKVIVYGRIKLQKIDFSILER